MAALTITVAEVQPGTTGAKFLDAIAGETLTAGVPCYLDASDNSEAKKTDSDASSATAKCRGITTHGALTGQPIRLQYEGDITLGASAAMVVGETYACGPVAGSIHPHGDIANPSRKSLLGTASAAGVLKLAITNTDIVRAA